MLSSRPVVMRSSGVKKSRAKKISTIVKAAGYSKSTPTYLEFAEKVNGRAAQQGFVWGAVNEAFTGHDVRDQIYHTFQNGMTVINYDDILNIVIVIAAVFLGSAITTFAPNEELEKKSREIAPQFTDNAELLNGRLAMIGFVLLTVLY
jgi:hypothetical protein